METIQVRILQASDGKYLYNGDTICRFVQLAPSASPNDWREVTEAEKEEIERKEEIEMKKQEQEEAQKYGLVE